MLHWAELDEPWQVALEQAWAAYRAGSLPIGARGDAPHSLMALLLLCWR